MTHRIRRHHARYRVFASPSGGAALTGRLDRVSREALGTAWADAMSQALPGDAVYIVRRASVAYTVDPRDGLDDGRLAQRWGERLAGAVARAIADDMGDGGNVVRFADEAEYVARFIADVLDGRAWRSWWYGAFATWRGRTAPEAVLGVLLEHRARVPGILACLRAMGTLPAVWAALDVPAQRTLWRETIAAAAPTDAEAVRPLFAAALRLVDGLGWRTRAAGAAEHLFADYIAASPPAADWRDREGLARGVLDALRFLARRGVMCWPTSALPAGWLARAKPDLDWLDVDWLEAAIERAQAVPSPAAAPAPAWPTRPAHLGGATPRQRALLDDLLALLRAEALDLDASAPAAEGNALRLYAALVGRQPRWVGDPLAPAMIEHVLTAWAERARSRSTADGDAAAGGDGRVATTPATRGVLGAVAAWGERAAEIVALLEARAGDPARQRPWVVDTPAAGVFLLLRSMLDLRLYSLAPHAPAALWAAIGMRAGGVDAGPDGEIDAGLALPAGLGVPCSVTVLRSALMEPWDWPALQAALLARLVGQRVIAADRLHIHRVDVGAGTTAIVAGDAAAQVWPLGEIVRPGAPLEPVLSRWVDAWQSATGMLPVVRFADPSFTAALPADYAGGTRVVGAGESGPILEGRPAARVHPSGGDEGDADPGAPASAAFDSGARALAEAWRAMARGCVGDPDVDLTIGLVVVALARAWARWLPRFSASSPVFVLDTFLRRPGRIHVTDAVLFVEMDGRPLDLVPRMAGYFDPLARVPWLGHRTIELRVRETT